MEELYNKYSRELDLVLPTTEIFKKENSAIKLIKDYLLKQDPTKFTQAHFDILSYEIWKFYRVFKMKEFILLYNKRIKAEVNCIDSTANKTIEMLDRAFLWHITNWSGDSKRKYEQRFYSESALKNFAINKESYYKLSIANRNLLIDLINEKKNYLQFKQIIPYPKKCEKEINNKAEQEILEHLDGETTNLLSFIETTKIEDFKSLIHAFACQDDSKIQLDHVLNRISIKNYIENLCNSFTDKTEEIIEQINNAVDLILPYMFGSVVYKDENEQLKSNLDIDLNLGVSIWQVYIIEKINMYDFDSILNNSPKLINEQKCYEKIEIDNPYDSIALGDTVYNWCHTNQKWIYSTHNSV
jgi:hypothetical protein